MDILNMIIDVVKNWSSYTSPALQVGAVVSVLIGLWKASILQPYWDKLGAAKVLVGPLLGVLAQLAVLGASGFSWAALWEGVQSGALAIALAALMDGVKALPAVGDKYKGWIDFLEKILFKPKAS